MSWIKYSLQQLILIIGTISVVDVVAYNFFKEPIQTSYFVSYGMEVREFGRGYPRYHFRSDPNRGFDIRKNFQTTTARNPPEYGTYKVWGNSYGCFDKERKFNKTKHENVIYLAGDSVTWGYTQFEKKFGSILGRELAVPVMSCGVTHTGQRHQFFKFKSLLEQLKITPKVVVVTYVPNDVENDYFFPHTTVIDGYQIENIEICKSNKGINWERISDQNLINEYQNFLTDNSNSMRNIIRQYSLTANIFWRLYKEFKQSFTDAYYGNRVNIENFEGCVRGLSVKLLGYEPADYAESNISKPNRETMEAWAQHARDNDYHLIYAFFRHKDPNERKVSEYAQQFAATLDNIIIADFDEYTRRNGIETEKLYFKFDGHFSEFGNQVFSEFLNQVLVKNELLN